MKAQHYTLPNGLNIVLIDTKAFPSLTTLLLVGAGSRYENEKNNGVAHFFEHMAFKGSKKYPSSMIMASTIEGFGGVFNAFTAKDHTGYWIKAPSTNFETVIDVIADMIQRPLLKDEEIEREKGVIVEEINLYEDTPYRKVGELYESLVYNGNPLGFDIAGTKKTVTAFTRQTFLDYIGEYYHPKNAILAVAGGLNEAGNYLEIIENKFKNWKNGGRSEFEKMNEKQDGPRLLVKTKKTEQTHFCMGYRAFSQFSEKKHTLSILAAILGGGMSSRLFYQIRERRGLCYYISTTRDLYQDVGALVTQAGVPVNKNKVKEAINLTIKEHQKIAKGDVKQEELDRAKELMRGRLILSLEDSSAVANFFGKRLLMEEKTETLEVLLSKINSVTLEDIVNVAGEIIRPERLNIALIGPFKKNDLKSVIE